MYIIDEHVWKKLLIHMLTGLDFHPPFDQCRKTVNRRPRIDACNLQLLVFSAHMDHSKKGGILSLHVACKSWSKRWSNKINNRTDRLQNGFLDSWVRTGRSVCSGWLSKRSCWLDNRFLR